MPSIWYSKSRHCYIFCCYNLCVAVYVAEYDRRVVIKGRSGARDDGLYTKKNRCKTKVLQRLSAFKDFSDAHSEGILKPFCGERGIRTPGASQLNGFQDRRNRPLCHLSIQVKEIPYPRIVCKGNTFL